MLLVFVLLLVFQILASFLEFRPFEHDVKAILDQWQKKYIYCRKDEYFYTYDPSKESINIYRTVDSKHTLVITVSPNAVHYDRTTNEHIDDQPDCIEILAGHLAGLIKKAN